MSTASQLNMPPLVERVPAGSHLPEGETFLIMSRAWEEDGVWTVEAFDLPVVVSGDTIEEAQQNFDDAVVVHFWGLQELGKVKSTIKQLRKLAEARDFYTERILESDRKEREVAYPVLMTKPHQLCAASM